MNDNLNIQEAAARQKKIFGGRLRALRNNAGLTQRQLAEKSGYTTSVIARYEAGGVLPRPQAIEKLAAALGVPVADLDGSNIDKEFKIRVTETLANDLKRADIKATFKNNFETAILTGPDIGKIEMPVMECMDIVHNAYSEINDLLAPIKIRYLGSFIKIKLVSSTSGRLLEALKAENPEMAAKYEKVIEILNGR